MNHVADPSISNSNDSIFAGVSRIFGQDIEPDVEILLPFSYFVNLQFDLKTPLLQSRFSLYLTPEFTTLQPNSETGEASTEPQPETPDREAVKVLVIGSRRGVTNILQTLYRLGFAEIGEWSPFLPGPNPGEVMTILTRYLLTSS
jgi:hypothetical protein